MRKSYTYEGILSAVGRVLDEAGVSRIAIHETADGLMVEGLDATGQPSVTMPLDVPELYALLSRGSEHHHTSSHHAAEEAHTLRQFLDQHELVGAR